MTKHRNRSRLKTIWHFGRKYTIYFIIAQICMLVTYAVSILLPLNFTRLVDQVFNQGHHHILNEVIYAYIIMFVLSAIFNMMYAYTWQSLHNKFIVDVKTGLFSKIINLRAKYLSSSSTGDMTERIGNDGEQFIHIIIRNGFHFFNSFLLIIVILIMIWRIHYVVALIIFIAAFLPVMFSKIFSKLNEALHRKNREIRGGLTGKVFEILGGLVEVKLLCANRWAKKEIFSPLRKIIKLENKIRYTDLKTDKAIYAVNLATSLIIYAYSLQLIIDGRMTVGVFLALVQYVALLHRKLNWMLRIYLDYNGRKVSVDRVREILSLESECASGDEIQNVERVEFQNVFFKYNEEVEVLKDISFKVRKGEKIAVAGASGEGKTTISSLLLKFYEPTEGKILIDGKDISTLKASSVREQVGIVLQENYILNESIRYNITMGNEEIDDDKIWDICKKLNIYDCIASLPEQLDTVISQKKSILSGGEKQRMKIARILLRNYSILIFDEATSALDTETEKIVVKNIFAQNPDTIIFMISHRKETINFCDRILTLKNGGLENEA